MHTLIENLKDLSNQILLAKKQNDYNKIIEIDKDRRIIIDQIFSKGIKTLSEEDIKTKPVYEKNKNVDITLKSSHPAPATLRAMAWEGDYSPLFYKRA